MTKYVELDVRSEIGELEGVILHTPGSEVENMTPVNAERALYSDILNLSVAQKEYKQLSGSLGEITQTYQVKDLLANILKDDKVKEIVIDKVCKIEPELAVKGNTYCIKDILLDQTAEDLALTTPENYLSLGVNFQLNAKVTQIDKAAKFVTTESGNVYAYDKLILATAPNERIFMALSSVWPICKVYGSK